jgi:hypothetical protein
MTEELEQKLNELLGLKKQMEEATAEHRKNDTLSMVEKYKKEARRAPIRSRIALAISFVFILFGALGLGSTQIIIMGQDICGTPAQYALGGTFMLIGFFLISIILLGSIIRATKLQILIELKQFELRLTELLKK